MCFESSCVRIRVTPVDFIFVALYLFGDERTQPVKDTNTLTGRDGDRPFLISQIDAIASLALCFSDVLTLSIRNASFSQCHCTFPKKTTRTAQYLPSDQQSPTGYKPSVHLRCRHAKNLVSLRAGEKREHRREQEREY